MNKITYNLLFFCLIFFLIDLYFWQAIKNNDILSRLNSSILKKLYWSQSLVSLPVLVYLMVNYHNPKSPSYFIVLRSFILCIYLSKFLALAPLLIDDILRGLKFLFLNLKKQFYTNTDTQDISRLHFLKNLSIITGASILGLLTWGTLFGRFNFKIREIPLKLSNFPEKLNGLKLVQISDLHLGSFTSVTPIKEIVTLINNEEPDIIVFTGDIINNYIWEFQSSQMLNFIFE